MRLRIILLLAIGCACPLVSMAQSWHSMGPPGGDVYSATTDPQRSSFMYIGTPDGHVFGSRDAGDSWKLLGRVSARTDSVVATLLVDPRRSQTLFAGTWTRDPSLGAGGGVFRSDDGGTTWSMVGLAGQAVRTIVQSPSRPDLLVAGTLEGVFASADFGATWERISPEANEELRNIDSLAVDPGNPEIIYVGTFHLPWKTSDGGKTWTSIHRGMIDDSDVMSFLVDRTNPARVFASACSGIYRSNNGGALWQKVQGIPFSARRTHVLAQDSEQASVIYAGTTEGLWKSEDAGGTWRRITPSDWVINSVEAPISRSGRIIIGTDDLGILVSDDRGVRFRPSNGGFNHRRTVALALDPDRDGRVLAVLANGPDPLLITDDGGLNWTALGKSVSAEVRKMRRVYAAPDGWWAALAGGGLIRYDAARAVWVREGRLSGDAANIAAKQLSAAKPARRTRATSTSRNGTVLNWIIHDMAFAPSRWFAASEYGLLVSENHGRSWNLMPLGPLATLPVSSVRVSRDGKSIWVVSLRGMVYSRDGGRTWSWRDLPLEAGGALRLDIARGNDESETFVATAHKGLFISRDSGETWEQAASGLPQTPVEDFALIGETFVVSPTTGGLYLSIDSGRTWKRLPGTIAEGFFSAVVAPAGGRSVVAASSDGVYSLVLTPSRTAIADLGRQ